MKDVRTKFEIRDFASSMLVQDQTEGCLYQSKEQMAAKKLTTPHSVTLVDFDGDCISDLFVTVEDKGRNITRFICVESGLNPLQKTTQI